MTVSNYRSFVQKLWDFLFSAVVKQNGSSRADCLYKVEPKCRTLRVTKFVTLQMLQRDNEIYIWRVKALWLLYVEKTVCDLWTPRALLTHNYNFQSTVVALTPTAPRPLKSLSFLDTAIDTAINIVLSRYYPTVTFWYSYIPYPLSLQDEFIRKLFKGPGW